MKVDIYNTKNQYDLILADPAWKQMKGGKKSVRPVSSGTALDYPVCSLEEIIARNQRFHMRLSIGFILI